MLSTQKYYMQGCYKIGSLHKMSDEERQKLQAHLRMMYIEIEKVCNKHNLTFMLGFGNVLGAVRHHGFIPWDDDMDIFMPRDDYDAFINIYCKELPERFKLFAPNSLEGPIYRFAKLVDTTTRFLTPGSDPNSEKKGIYVDIFPLENAPVNKWHMKCRKIICYFLMYVATSVADYEHDNLYFREIMFQTLPGRMNYYFRKTIGFLFGIKNSVSWYNTFDKFSQYKERTGYWCVPSTKSGFVARPKSFYIPVVKMEFDDISVNVPHEYISYLESEYGDWRRIPQENERWQHFMQDIKFNV